MKKHFALFFVYCTVIIAGLCLVLVFHKNTELTQPDEQESEQIGASTSYATSLTLNCARTIEMEQNSSIELLSGFISVSPAEKLSEIETTITPDTGTEGGLTFANNIVNATEIGKYRIKFSIARSATKTLTDTIVINVVENYEEKITQNLFTTTLEESTIITDIVTIDSAVSSYTVSTDSKANYNNGYLLASSVGESEITILYDTNFIRRTFSCFINIKEKPQYAIYLTDLSSNTEILGNQINYSCNVGDTFFIMYEIKNNNEEYVSQEIDIESNSTILTYTLFAPLIKIECLSKGSANIKLICSEDTSVYINLIINFV